MQTVHAQLFCCNVYKRSPTFSKSCQDNKIKTPMFFFWKLFIRNLFITCINVLQFCKLFQNKEVATLLVILKIVHTNCCCCNVYERFATFPKSCRKKESRNFWLFWKCFIQKCFIIRFVNVLQPFLHYARTKKKKLLVILNVFIQNWFLQCRLTCGTFFWSTLKQKKHELLVVLQIVHTTLFVFS